MKVIAGPEEATAVGNAVVQALALGVISKVADARAMIRAAFPIKEYQPRESDTWARAYDRYRAIVK
jgi:sugar (pentulose or hexulose) kinase